MRKLEGIQGAMADAVLCLSSIQFPDRGNLAKAFTVSGFSLILMGCPQETTVDTKLDKISDRFTSLDSAITQFAKSYERVRKEHDSSLFANLFPDKWRVVENDRLDMMKKLRSFELHPQIQNNEKIKDIIREIRERTGTLCRDYPFVQNDYQQVMLPNNQKSLTKELLPNLRQEVAKL